jgi:hypothetical protein
MDSLARLAKSAASREGEILHAGIVDSANARGERSRLWHHRQSSLGSRVSPGSRISKATCFAARSHDRIIYVWALSLIVTYKMTVHHEIQNLQTHRSRAQSSAHTPARDQGVFPATRWFALERASPREALLGRDDRTEDAALKFVKGGTSLG